jgi:hypothetical protein
MIIKTTKSRVPGHNTSRLNNGEGLVDYLLGEGHHNEHTEQHIIADNDEWIKAITELNSSADLAQEAKDYLAENTPTDISRSSKHIMHVVFSLNANEQSYSDEEWNQIAHEWAKFVGVEDESNPDNNCHWVAFRHGKSREGNDHIHLVVNKFHADGSRWSDSKIGWKNNAARKHLEERFKWIMPLASDTLDRNIKPFNQGEWRDNAEQIAAQKYENEHGKGTWGEANSADKKAAIRGVKEIDLPRRKLQGLVRAASVSSKSEDEFVRRLRSYGVLLNPHFDSSGNVQSFKVKLRTEDELVVNKKANQWITSGQLANDLTPGRLREMWAGIPDPSEREPGYTVPQEVYRATPDALDEWHAAQEHKPTVHMGRESYQVSRDDILNVNQELVKFGELLRQNAADGKPHNMATTSRYLSGCFAQMSRRFDFEGSPIAMAGEQLSRAAQTRNNARFRGNTSLSMVALSGAAMVLASKNNQYVAIAMMIATILEIARLVEENYRLEQEIFQAQKGLVLLEDEVQLQMNLTKNLGLTESRSRVDADILSERERANNARGSLDSEIEPIGDSNAKTTEILVEEVEPEELSVPTATPSAPEQNRRVI